MRTKQVFYWLTTTILCGLMLYSASMYFVETEKIKHFFKTFSFPEYLVIPLAILKLLGIAMIIWRKSKWLTEWAYAGFFFNLVLATLAHYYNGDGILGFSFYALLVLFPSYFLGKYLRD